MKIILIATLLVAVLTVSVLGYHSVEASHDPNTPEAPVLSKSVSGGQVHLSWTNADPNNLLSSPIKYYIVQAEIWDNGNWSRFYLTASHSVSFWDTGEEGIPYKFRVYAVNENGNGHVSNEVAHINPTTPDAPENLSALQSGNRQITLSWDVPEYDGGEPITQYVISARIGNVNPYTELATVDASSTSYVATGLVANATYEFVVNAVNSQGSGDSSNTATQTASGACTSSWCVG